MSKRSIDALIRPNVEKLEAYIPEPQQAQALLNANENPYSLPDDVTEVILSRLKTMAFNRYPDPRATVLRETVADYMKLPAENILCGNGLDEILSILTNAFVGKADTVVSHLPGFSMYDIWTEISDGRFIGVPDLENYVIDTAGLIDAANTHKAKLVYVCSPNNPTGYKIPKEDVQRLLDETSALIVLDEAYIDFDGNSYIDLLSGNPRLVVLRTLSKAFRIPSVRCGYAVADPAVLEAMYKVKSPYNMSAVTQLIGSTVLEHAAEVLSVVPEIVAEREAMYLFLSSYPQLTVYNSSANFIYVQSPKAQTLQDAFLSNGVLVRYYKNDGAFRISIGTPKENALVRKSVIDAFGEA